MDIIAMGPPPAAATAADITAAAATIRRSPLRFETKPPRRLRRWLNAFVRLHGKSCRSARRERRRGVRSRLGVGAGKAIRANVDGVRLLHAEQAAQPRKPDALPPAPERLTSAPSGASASSPQVAVRPSARVISDNSTWRCG